MRKIYPIEEGLEALKQRVQPDFPNVMIGYRDSLLCSHILIPPRGGAMPQLIPLSLGEMIYLPDGVNQKKLIPIYAMYLHCGGSRQFEGIGFLDYVFISHIDSLGKDDPKLFGLNTMEELIQSARPHPGSKDLINPTHIISAAHIEEIVNAEKMQEYLNRKD